MRQFLMIAVFLAAPAVCAAQATWYVPDDFPAGIQAALSDPFVVAGDTIVVRAGTYGENIDFLGKNVHLKSKQGPEVTVIEGNQTASVVVFQNGESRQAILDGFTLTNGGSTPVNDLHDNIGGGICCKGSAPTIQNNIIRDNQVTGDAGGGIGCAENANPLIQHNQILDNWGNEWGGGISCCTSSLVIVHNRICGNSAGKPYHIGCGGGIYAVHDSHVILQHNLIQGNWTVEGSGAGFNSTWDTQVTIENNVFTENVSYASGGGLAVSVGKASCTISGNLITHNQAGLLGGGVWFGSHNGKHCIRDNIIAFNEAENSGGGIYSSGSPLITNNLVYMNKAGPGIGAGGGICTWIDSLNVINNTIVGNEAKMGGGYYSKFGNPDLADPLIANSILWGNTAGQGPQIYLADDSKLKIHHCDVEGGQALVHTDPACVMDWGSGMLDLDPLFADAANHDYHIRFDSPVKDGGHSTLTYLPALDFEGDPRIAYSAADMGADEFHPHLYIMGDTAPGGTVTLKIVGRPGNFINCLILGTTVFESPIPCDYGLWYIQDPMILTTGFGNIRSNGYAVFKKTIPSIPMAPYTAYLQAAIDAWLTNLCVVEVE